MKKIITLVLVSALGGAITLSSYKYFLEEKPTVVKTHELIELPPKVVANYETNTANLESLNPNFVTAAENTINTVVHVQNTAIGRRQMTMEDLKHLISLDLGELKILPLMVLSQGLLLANFIEQGINLVG